MDEILKDLEKDIDKRRKTEDDKEKKQLLNKLDDYKEKASPKISQKIILVGIIILLLAFIGYDRLFVHPKLSEAGEGITSLVTDVDKQEDSTTTTTVSDETTTTTVIEETTTTTTTVPEEVITLSGNVALSLVDIKTEKTSNTTGQIQSITFTIENGLETSIIPVVNVFAYDDEIINEWEEISRGEYNSEESIEIDSGKNQTGSILLSPKSIADPDLIKTVVLKLKYSDDADEIRISSKIKID